jgi:hypothetical protein
LSCGCINESRCDHPSDDSEHFYCIVTDDSACTV